MLISCKCLRIITADLLILEIGVKLRLVIRVGDTDPAPMRRTGASIFGSFDRLYPGESRPNFVNFHKYGSTMWNNPEPIIPVHCWTFAGRAISLSRISSEPPLGNMEVLGKNISFNTGADSKPR